MKFAITRGIEGRRLREGLPSEVRDRVPSAVRKDERYAVVLFPHTKEDVVRSPEVAKALRKVVAPDLQVIAVGGTFTLEARAMLEARGTLAVSVGDFFWTDESYVAIRRR